MKKSKKNLRESFDSYYYRDDEDIHSSRQVRDLFKRELFHPTKDYSRQMKQAMAYTVEKNLHEKEKKNMKDTLNESEYDNPYGFTYKNTVITDKFGNYWTMDTWANGLSEPYATFDDAEASMLQCMEDCGLPSEADVADPEDYAFEFTTYAARVVPNYIVGYETEGDDNDFRNRVHSFAFDFVITGDDLASADEARDRILNEISLVEGIQIVGNPNCDPCSWTKKEYGLSESVELNESEEDKPEKVVAYYDEHRCLLKNGSMEKYDSDAKKWKLYASNRDEVKEFGDDDLLKWYDEKTKTSEDLKEDAGKYTVSWEKYERYGSGGVSTKSFSAKDDFDAILKIKKHKVGPIYGINILVDDNTVFEGYDKEPKSMEDAVAESGCDDAEEYKEEYEPLKSVEEILEYAEGANGDGDDYIFYIKRPDGTYLFKADDADADDDWDDDEEDDNEISENLEEAEDKLDPVTKKVLLQAIKYTKGHITGKWSIGGELLETIRQHLEACMFTDEDDEEIDEAAEAKAQHLIDVEPEDSVERLAKLADPEGFAELEKELANCPEDVDDDDDWDDDYYLGR